MRSCPSCLSAGATTQALGILSFPLSPQGVCSFSVGVLDSPGGRLKSYPGAHTVLARDVSTGADEVDAII